MKINLISAIALSSLAFSPAAFATNVPGTAVIYYPNDSVGAGNAGGIIPLAISVGGDSALTFSVTGSVVLNITSGNNFNDPDGVGAAPSSSFNTGTATYGGISAPYGGYLTGLFTSPTDLTAGAGTSYTLASEMGGSFSPAMNEAFFIGDGLTGDGTGTTQTFYVPTGATELYLGISDSCGYGGGPSCYGDNGGSFTVTYTPVVTRTGATPEPSSLVLLGTGLAGVCSAIRRRVRK